MRVRTRLAALGLTCALAVAGVLGTVGAPAQADPIFLTAGHIDVFALGYDGPGGQVTVGLLDDTGSQPVPRDPAEVTLVVHNGHTWSPAMNLTCVATTQEQIWRAPRLSTSGLLWLGWNTDGTNLGQFVGGRLVAELVHADTPPGGEFVVWDPGTPGTPRIRFHSSSSCDPGGTDIVESHHHTDWGFTAAGVYQLTFQFHGEHQSTGLVTSDEVTYTFRVGLD